MTPARSFFLMACLVAAGCGPSPSISQQEVGSSSTPTPIKCPQCAQDFYKKTNSASEFSAGKGKLTEDDYDKITKRLAKDDEPLDWNKEFKDKALDAPFLRKLIASEQRFLYGIRIQNAPIAGKIDLSYQTVAHYIDLKNCQFLDAVTLKGTVFPRGLSCTSAQFFGDVDTDYLQSDGVIDVQKSHFHMGVNARLIKVRMLDLTECRFDCRLDLSYSEITSNLEARGGVCLALAQFDGMKIGGYAFLSDRVFRADLNFRALNVGAVLFAWDCVFCRNADFQRTRAGDGARVDRSCFVGDLIFKEASLGNGLNMVDVRFGQGKVDLSYLGVLHLNLAPKVGANALTSLDLRGIDVKGKFALNNVSLQQLDLRFSSIHSIDFDEIQWPELEKDRMIDGLTYQEIVDRSGEYRDVRGLLRGAKFSISAYMNLEDYLKKQGNQAHAIEVFWEMKERQRYQYLAKWREQERQTIGDLNLSDLVSYAWSWFLRIFVGYGAYPAWALGWGVLVVAIGMVVFPRRFMERTEKGEDSDSSPRLQGQYDVVLGANPIQVRSAWRRFVNWWRTPGGDYSRFWFSLDLFVPAINLEAAKNWRPKPERWGVRIWFRVQRILGWIIIPIGLVAWSGIVKL